MPAKVAQVLMLEIVETMVLAGPIVVGQGMLHSLVTTDYMAFRRLEIVVHAV
jgi:hypothetical protein